MLKKTIKFEDFDGNVREEDFYFNLTKAEIMEMELTTTGGMEQMIRNIISAKDVPKIVTIFKDIILKAYGVKSPDGRRFIKNDELRDEFAQTQAYSELFMELATDSDAAANFVNSIIPAESKEAIANAKEVVSLPANN